MDIIFLADRGSECLSSSEDGAAAIGALMLPRMCSLLATRDNCRPAMGREAIEAVLSMAVGNLPNQKLLYQYCFPDADNSRNVFLQLLAIPDFIIQTCTVIINNSKSIS
eukprot:1712868-Pyramimonas_sp.AAC.2